MSTRCCVEVIQTFNHEVHSVTLYHHHDGYPEGVGLDLLKRSKNWKYYSNRWDIDKVVNSLIKDAKDEYEYTAYNHTDIEYLYTIDCDAMTIKCNEIDWSEEGNKLGKEVKFTGMEG